MKFPLFPKGHLGPLLVLFLVTACNQQEEYFPTEEFVVGADSYCSQATDLASCQQLADQCQPAYLDLEMDYEEPVFTACVANPTYDPNSVPSGDQSTTPDSSVVVTDGGVTDPAAPVEDGSVSTDPTAPVEDGSVSADPTDPVASIEDPAVEEPAEIIPTLQDAFKSKCKNLDEKYLWTKKIVSKKATQHISKVKLCHMSGNGDSHTIIIACPALKAHMMHQDQGDYLGACEL